jgi:hypothetical protein
VLHGGFGAADHLAVTPFEAPDAAGHADVDIVDALFREVLRPTDVVLVVAVATVDDDVALFEVGGDLLERFIDEATGSIIQVVRGFSSLETKSSMLVAPIAPSASSDFTASWFTS